MFQEILQEIGLSKNESKIYETLVQSGQLSIEDISLKAKVHRRNVYDSLNKLIEKGLVSDFFIEGKKRLKATNPNRLQDILKEKENRLLSILPGLEKKYDSKDYTSEAYFYKGVQGFKNYLNDILKTNETVHFMGAKAFWLDTRLQTYLKIFEAKRKKQGIKFRHIFDQEVKTEKPDILKLVGKPYKFLPKKYSSETAIDIFGDYVVMFVGVKPGYLDEEPLQFVIKNRRLADGYRKMFEFMWDFCPDK